MEHLYGNQILGGLEAMIDYKLVGCVVVSQQVVHTRPMSERKAQVLYVPKDSNHDSRPAFLMRNKVCSFRVL